MIKLHTTKINQFSLTPLTIPLQRLSYIFHSMDLAMKFFQPLLTYYKLFVKFENKNKENFFTNHNRASNSCFVIFCEVNLKLSDDKSMWSYYSYKSPTYSLLDITKWYPRKLKIHSWYITQYLRQPGDTLVVFLLGVHQLYVGGVQVQFVVVCIHSIHRHQLILPTLLPSHSSRGWGRTPGLSMNT